ncbi:MAG: class I SAM-dependent methyltransferase, partial [Chlamydiales bacterium]
TFILGVFMTASLEGRAGIQSILGNGVAVENWDSYTESTQSFTATGATHAYLDLASKRISAEAIPCTSLLDVGSGTGGSTLFFLKEFPTLTRIVAVDFDPNALQRLQERVSEIALETSFQSFSGDVCQIDFGDEQFDLVNGTDCFSYLGNGDGQLFEEAMEKVLRLVKVGGVFCGDFFGDQMFWTEKGRGHSHVTVTLEAISAILKDNGFEILEKQEGPPEDPNPKYAEYMTKKHKISVVARRK